jgi:hypothetical protein
MDAFSVMAALCVICMAPWSECLEEVGRDPIGSEAMVKQVQACSVLALSTTAKAVEEEDESKSMDGKEPVRQSSYECPTGRDGSGTF